MEGTDNERHDKSNRRGRHFLRDSVDASAVFHLPSIDQQLCHCFLSAWYGFLSSRV
jgi:hypothetical protein